jgi:hypothetical protein
LIVGIPKHPFFPPAGLTPSRVSFCVAPLVFASYSLGEVTHAM